MDGIIEGGWGYVWAVYGLTWTVLTLYGASIYLRGRAK